MNKFWDGKRYDDFKSIARKIEGLAEILVFALVYYYAYSRFYRQLTTYAFYGRGRYVIGGLYVLLCLLLISQTEGLQFGNRKIFDVLTSQMIAMGLVNLITYLQLSLMSARMVPVWPMALVFVVQCLLIAVFCLLFTRLYYVMHSPWNMIMIYGLDNALNMKEKMDTRGDKYRITKMMSVEEGFEAICSEIIHYDAVVMSDIEGSLRNDILKFCYKENIRTYIVPKISDVIIKGAKSVEIFDTPLLVVKTGGLTHEQRFIKRLCDIVLVLIALIPGSIIMLVIAIAIKLEDGGSIFFKQKRLTRGLREFDILKFRSMIENAEAEGKAIKAVDDDDRITKVGRIIRPLRLDELPQLFNILKGEMSIVGPRPERIENVREYMETVPEFRFRTKVKAGLTGYAQIYGKYNTTAYDKLRLDLNYIESYSLLLDFKLMLMTFQVLIKKESTEGFSKDTKEQE